MVSQDLMQGNMAKMVSWGCLQLRTHPHWQKNYRIRVGQGRKSGLGLPHPLCHGPWEARAIPQVISVIMPQLYIAAKSVATNLAVQVNLYLLPHSSALRSMGKLHQVLCFLSLSQGTQVSASLGSDVEAQEKNLLLGLVISLAEFSSCGYWTKLPVFLLVVTWGAVLCSALIPQKVAPKTMNSMLNRLHASTLDFFCYQLEETLCL